METFQKESCIRGYHIYRERWDAVVGEKLECQRERGNTTDMYAVAVIKDSTIVGHLPRKISRICTLCEINLLFLLVEHNISPV